MAKHTKKFKTEVQQLLDLVIHSLYSKKEIFLRELISNASDAIDRARFEALTNPELLEVDDNWKIKIIPNEKAGTLTIVDNGIGMSAKEVETNIGTIANSGTKQFLADIQKSKKDAANPEFIGQFGVGFYAAFMVADKVTLVTKRGGKDQQAVKWTSAGAGNYSLEDTDRKSRGTEITLHLREDMTEYLAEWKIREIVKHYSDYIAFPVTMDITRTEKSSEEGAEDVKTVTEETLNSIKAIWKRAKTKVTNEEYNDFYKHISHDFTDPLKIVHFAAEGITEFQALLYIPSQPPMDLFSADARCGLHLYVKNVFIGDDIKELLPEYLRFVKGVVDSSDLPLNVSREILQDDVIIKRIRKSAVGKILGTITDLKKQGIDDYLKFYTPFGKTLKEGIHSDFDNFDKLKELVAFHSTKSEDGKPVFLADYIKRMPEDQTEIYYLTGDSVKTAADSPHLEIFKSKGFEVLFLIDPIDEWVTQRLTEYDGKKLKAVDRGDIDLDSEEEKKEKEAKREEENKEYDDLLKHIEKKLENEVKNVKLSSRLTDSAACLVADEMGMNANMERIMKAMNQPMPTSKRIFELNPNHPVIRKINGLLEKEPDSSKLADYIELIYDQALLTEGSQIRNPLKFTKLVSELMMDAG